MGTFEGIAWMVPGNKKGYGQPVSIKASDNKSILLSFFFDFKQNKWEHRDCSHKDQKKKNPKDHCTSVVAFDWDNDKDLDLILGGKEGRLYLRYNNGKPKSPAYVSFNKPIKAGNKHLKIPGGLTAPRLVDWDGDGLTDLVCGSTLGGVFLCKNSGKLGEPKFEEPQALIPNVRSGYVATALKRPTSSSYVDAVDYDKDGDLDLIVGGYTKWKAQPRKLNEKEQAKVTEIQNAFKEIKREYEKLSANANREAEEKNGGKLTAAQSKKLQDEIVKSDEYKVLLDRRKQCLKEVDKLQLRSRYEASIWLYERK